MVYPPDDKFAQHFENLNQQVGYLHNEFIVEFINDNLKQFKDSTDFVNALHQPLVEKLSQSFSMSTEEIESIFDKKKLISDLDTFSKTFNESDTEIIIDNLVSIVQENYKDGKIPSYFEKVLIETANTKDLDVETYFDKKIEEIKHNKNFKDLEKEILFDSLNAFKYSLALWNKNIK